MRWLPVKSTFLNAFLLCVSVASFGQRPSSVKLTILHTNDTHGHLLPYSYPQTDDPGMEVAHLERQTNIGGAARRATLINRIRAEKGHATLLVDGGDICDGTPLSVEYHGDADIAAMNALGYDVAVPGNHEFNNKLAQVLKLARNAKFPMVCANVKVRDAKSTPYKPYVIKVVSGIKIGFLGLTTYEGRTYPAAKEGFDFAVPIDTAKKLVPELRKQVDLVVAVTHIGVDEDQQLAAAIPGIDVIVGSHSHTMLPHGLHVAGYKQSNFHKSTVIVQNFQWAATLGRLDLTIKHEAGGGWRVSEFEENLLPVTSTIPEDPIVAKVVSTYWSPIKAKYAAVVGIANGDFTERGQDAANYNMVADAVKEQLKVDFDLENSGGVRAPLVKGPITQGDLLSMDPFGNTIVTYKISGRQLKEILERVKPAVSGIRYRIEDGKLTEATIGGLPIADTRIFEGATNSYLASQPEFADVADKVDTKRPRLDAVIEYLKKYKTISPSYDSRRVVKSGGL